MSERQKAQASIENVKSVEKFNFPFLFFRHFKGKPFFHLHQNAVTRNSWFPFETRPDEMNVWESGVCFAPRTK